MNAVEAEAFSAVRANAQPTVSAVVVAHNEEAQLADCLAALSFADEIVVLLDRCTDRSRDIAKRFADRVVEGAWPREAPRRSAAIAACTGEWIFEADADERVSPALAAEIRAVIAHSSASWHLVPVDNYIGDRLVRWGWGAFFGRSAHAGLYRRGVKNWADDRVLHASVTLTGQQGPTLAAAARALRRSQYFGHADPARPLHDIAGAGPARQRRHRQLCPQYQADRHRVFGSAMSAAAAIEKALTAF